MDRLRNIVVVVVSALGLIGLGLLGAGEGSAGGRDARGRGSASMDAGRASEVTAQAFAAPLDGFCAIGLGFSAHDGRHHGGATR
jgi:hypothetical protein